MIGISLTLCYPQIGSTNLFCFRALDRICPLTKHIRLVGLQLRCVRTKTAKLTLELGSGAGEMYDLANDPHEMENLFGNLDYATLQRELTSMIHARPRDMCGTLAEPVGMA